MKPQIVLNVAIVCVGIVLLLIGLSPYYRQQPQVATSTVEIAKSADSPKIVTHDVRLEIPASEMWVDTGIDTTGKEVRIIYDGGIWLNHPTSRACDGHGLSPYADQAKLIVPQGNLSALVGKTGSGTFVVNNYKEVRNGRGRLYLSINDLPGEYQDNSGSLFVKLSIGRQ
jgi:hypothetical protein